MNMPNPIKPNLKTEILPILFILVSIVFSFYFYANFPERVATHWNFAGEPDGWSGKGFAAFFFPAFMIIMYLLLLFLPSTDPKKDRYDEFKGVYHIFKGYFAFFFALIYFIASLNNIGFNFNVGLFVSIGVGLLFIVIGNYLGKVKRNWFLGIRTPWTLSSEEVWNKTHRFGGKLFIVIGIVMMLTGISPTKWRVIIFIPSLIIFFFAIFAYSYIVYLKEKNASTSSAQGKKNNGQQITANRQEMIENDIKKH